MNNRIKTIRKSLKLTQKDFAEKLGVKRNTVAQWEIGVNGLSDQVIKSICREFNVNETWLRYGEGQIFKEARAFSLDELAESKGATELDIEIVKIYLELEPDIRRRAIEHFKKRLAALPDKPTKAETATELMPQLPSQSEPTTLKNDSTSEIKELKRQNRELQEQIKRQSEDFAELRKEMEELKQQDADAAYIDELSSLLFSTPESSDTEKAKTQETAHQHDH